MVVSTNDAFIQLKQKLIHYQSEVSQYKQKLERTEKQLQLEKQKYKALEKNKALPKPQEPARKEVVPLISYTLILPKDKDENLMVIGSFLVKNNGTVPLVNPIICLKISPAHAGKLSGKIKIPNVKQLDNEGVLSSTMEEWEFIHKDYQTKIKESGEYWLRPIHIKEVQPKETLSFSNFEIELQGAHLIDPFIVEAFVYGDDFPKGVTSLNSIIVN